MNLAFSPKALSALVEIHAYIAERNPTSAMKVIAAIEDQCQRLAEFPGLGRTTDFPGIRIAPLVRYPYLIFYTILRDADEVRILRIRHGAQRPATVEVLEN